MREWLTDEQRAREEAKAWKLRLEAWAIGTITAAMLIAAIVGLL
jgi:hypothetical protein